MKPKPKSTALELVTALAEDRDSAEHRFELGLALARASGERIGSIAQAARLSTSRVNAIIERQGKPFRELGLDEVDWVLETTFSVGIVPGGRIALNDYDDYGAYICQPDRPFRREMDRLGFYADWKVSPHFGKIRRVWPSVQFNADEARRLQASGDQVDAELGAIIERVLAAPKRGGHRPGRHKVILLTPARDPETLSLPQPIKHLERGRGKAFVRRQRYTSEAALRREPKTTAELLRYERA
jgi:hypothetical protein